MRARIKPPLQPVALVLDGGSNKGSYLSSTNPSATDGLILQEIFQTRRVNKSVRQKNKAVKAEYKRLLGK